MKNNTKSNITQLVIGLGINCTIGYGTLLYSFSLLSIELAENFAWKSEFIYGVYSLGILIAGLISPVIGKSLDKFGVYRPMTLGTILVSISFFCLSIIDSKVQFIAALILMEVASVFVLYEAAFVALTHHSAQQARSPMTQITLIAGFASTLFWPAISWLLTMIDWRQVYIIMACLHLFICLPMHFYLLKPIQKPNNDQLNKEKQRKKALLTVNLHPARTEILLAIAFGSIAFCITGIQIHIFNILSALSISEKLAIIAGALIGPTQVIARLMDLFLGRFINPIRLGIISVGSMLLGVLFLIGAAYINHITALLFAIAFGAGQGLTNIVRGSIPLFIFGHLNYGSITGRLNGARMIMTAIAPIGFSFMLQYTNSIELLMIVGVIMATSILLFIAVEKLKPKHLKNAN